MYFNTSDTVLVVIVVATVLVVGIMFTASTLGVTRATLKLRDVTHEYALADLRMRREDAARSFVFGTQHDMVRALAQIALDVTGMAHEVTNPVLDNGVVIAIRAASSKGRELVFTPNLLAYTRHHRLANREYAVYEINGLVSSPFVIEELTALIKSLGVTNLPRTEQWYVLILEPLDVKSLVRPTSWLRRLLPS
jgi:HAMP domain-containing protein